MRFVALKLALGCFGVLLSSSAQAGFTVPKHVYDLAGKEQAVAKARAGGKSLAFVYTDKSTSCGLCRRASQNLFRELADDCVIIYVDSLRHRKLPRSVIRALRSPLAGRYIPKAAITDLSGKVLAVVPYARDPKHVPLIKAALAKLPKRGALDGGGGLKLSLRWKGELDPMPLLVAARFLQKSGYKAKSLPGRDGLCRFLVEVDNCPRMAGMMAEYLRSRYRVSGGTCKDGSLEFELAPLADDSR